jgi:hypothetical protein
MPQKYRRIQVGFSILAALFGAIVLIDLIMLFTGLNAIAMLVVFLLFVVGFLFCTLTIEVSNGQLRASFGPGLIRKTVRMDEVQSCQPVTNPWYYGWGIRITPHGWLYNVSGFQAVELTLHSGRKIRIGTDQPEKLCEAIRTWL